MAFAHRFKDRAAAGIELARELQRRYLQPPVIILGLPRGGVAVAFEVARLLQEPLDVLLVRKIGLPAQPELAIGAIASGNITVYEPPVGTAMPDLAATFDRLVALERREIARRETIFRAGLAPLELKGKTVVLVDDGIATGSTMIAAIRSARKAGAESIIAAAPVASSEAAELIRSEADTIVILQTPAALFAIGQWYEQFEQLEDREVCDLLALSRKRPAPAPDPTSLHDARRATPTEVDR
jgi:predicted phosphoribosyltransferase